MKQKNYTAEEFKRVCQTMSKPTLIKEITSRGIRLAWYEDKNQIAASTAIFGGPIGVAILGSIYLSTRSKAQLTEICLGLQQQLQFARNIGRLKSKTKEQLVEKIKSRLYKNALHGDLAVDLIPAQFHSREEGESLISEEALLSATRGELITINMHLKDKLNEARGKSSAISAQTKSKVLTTAEKVAMVRDRREKASPSWAEAARDWDREWELGEVRRNALAGRLSQAIRDRHDESREQSRWLLEKQQIVAPILMSKYSEEQKKTFKADVERLGVTIGPAAMTARGKLRAAQINEINVEDGSLNIRATEDSFEAILKSFVAGFGLEALDAVISFEEEQIHRGQQSRIDFENSSNVVQQREVAPTPIPKYLVENGLSQDTDKDGKLVIIHAASGYRSGPIEDSFICNISHELMDDPVSNSVGHVYQRDNISRWFKSSTIDPKTGLNCNNTILTPSMSLRSQIMKFLENVVKEGGKLKQSEPPRGTRFKG